MATSNAVVDRLPGSMAGQAPGMENPSPLGRVAAAFPNKTLGTVYLTVNPNRRLVSTIIK